MSEGRQDNAASARWAQVCVVLDAVLEAPVAERARLLAEHCADDPALRAEVETLLRAEARAGELESPVLEWASPLLDDAAPEGATADPLAGTSIGPWRLIEELGRGGMGTVWLAERADGAFEQQVALKLLKRGLDSDAILGRFVAERRILARLTHPNIARLIDGGVAIDGRPYFAMERVEGAPITRWCDARRLPVRERLRLFLAVADAVQHAHRQLVVHRDLKPSNILVTATGEAKLLDFGIAKLLDAEEARADSATLTRLGFRMLTPEYAAPEQLRGEAVTTATDVYALGVLLYELLAGQRPTSARNQRTDQTDKADATTKPLPRPSTQISDAASQTRATSDERLKRILRGDLDTIVLRALHPEPERRYGSVEALRADLQRYLDGLPVQARPDSAWYRARKFVARNRVAVAAAGLVALALAGGLLATTWQAREAQHQARRANEVKNFLLGLFRASHPEAWRGKKLTAQDLLDEGARRVDKELADDPQLHAEMLATIGGLYLSQERLDRAAPLMRRAVEAQRRLHGASSLEYASALRMYSGVLLLRGELQETYEVGSRVVQIRRQRLGAHTETAEALRNLAHYSIILNRNDEAIRYLQEALRIDRQTHGNIHAQVARELSDLGALLLDLGRYPQAEPLLRESLEIVRRLDGEQGLSFARALADYANLLRDRGEPRQALTLYSQALRIARRYGENYQQLPTLLGHYGTTLLAVGRVEEAGQVLQEAMALRRHTRPLSQIDQGDKLNQWAIWLRDVGRVAEAEAPMRQSVEILENAIGSEHNWTITARLNLADLLLRQGQLAEAETLLRSGLAGRRRLHGTDRPTLIWPLRLLAQVRYRRGAHDEGLALAQEAVEVAERRLGAESRERAMAQLTLADIQVQERHFDAAEALQRQALVTLERTMGDEAPDTLTARKQLADMLARTERRPSPHPDQ